MDACLLLLFLVLFFSTNARDWLGRTSLKLPILCWVGLLSVQSVGENVVAAFFDIQYSFMSSNVVLNIDCREEAYAVFPTLVDAIGCLTSTICVRNCVEFSFKCTCGITCRIAEELSVVANKSGTVLQIISS